MAELSDDDDDDDDVLLLNTIGGVGSCWKELQNISILTTRVNLLATGRLELEGPIGTEERSNHLATGTVSYIFAVSSQH